LKGVLTDAHKELQALLDQSATRIKEIISERDRALELLESCRAQQDSLQKELSELRAIMTGYEVMSLKNLANIKRHKEKFWK
jgi:SUMO ligase MMS21 Smc5/6 complex component